MDTEFGEECDDGNRERHDGCDTMCEEEFGWTCTGEPSTCTGFCGDGMRVGAEATESGCDDGNTDAGDGCDASCRVEPGWDCWGTPTTCDDICGDGIVVGPEACDDGNRACGLCSSFCTSMVLPAPATGYLVVRDRMTTGDGGTFTLDDGAGTVITFEIDAAGDGITTPGARAIDISTFSIASSVAAHVALVISRAPIGITATRRGLLNIVDLTNDVPGATGNQPITHNGMLGDWTISGMSRGVGRDCASGEACTSDDDCRSASCTISAGAVVGTCD